MCSAKTVPLLCLAGISVACTTDERMDAAADAGRRPDSRPDTQPRDVATIDARPPEAGHDANAEVDASHEAGLCKPCSDGELRFCDNGIDDDCDGIVDCEDPDCSLDPTCTEDCTPDEVGLCMDFEDNDCDGLIDCDDPDCRICMDRETSCSNSFDDDCDGLVDCQDPDCVDHSWCTSCHPTETGLCFDGIDNDGDGTTDCADVDCARDLVCSGGVRTRCE